MPKFLNRFLLTEYLNNLEVENVSNNLTSIESINYLELLKYLRLQLPHRLRLPKMVLNLLLMHTMLLQHQLIVNVATISSLCFAGGGTASAPGFGASFAFAGKLELKNVIPKIDKTVPNPKR